MVSEYLLGSASEKQNLKKPTKSLSYLAQSILAS